MNRKTRPKVVNFIFWMSFKSCLAAALWLALPASLGAQTGASSSPDQKIELSTKNLTPAMRQMLLGLISNKNAAQYYLEKPLVLNSSYLGRRGSPSSYSYYVEGVDYITAGEYDKAITEFNKALRKGKFGEAYFGRGAAFILKGQYRQAVADFGRFLQLEPQSKRALYDRGLAYALQGRYPQALADFNKVIALDPQDGRAYYLRGFVNFKQGRGDRARSDYQTALKLAPDWVRQAAARGQGELDTYSRSLAGKAPGSRAAARAGEAAHKEAGLKWARQQQYDRALAEFTQALKIDPRDAETYNNRGSIYTLKGDYGAALADFTQALALNPKYAKAYYNRALAYYYQGKYDQAIKDLTRAIDLKPKDTAAYNNRGLAYSQKRQYDRAIMDFNMVIILNPKLADAYFNKAVACEKAGQAGEAREAYAQFLKMAPAGAQKQAAQARKKLEKP